jgi:seryl-tRNA synthetase
MHDIRFIRENPEVFDRTLARRNLTEQEKKNFSSQHLLSIDGHHRAIIRTLESWQARRNGASKAIGQAKAKKDETKIQELMAEVAECKTSISNLEGEEREAAERLKKILEQIPNLPLKEVPEGDEAADNVERHKYWPEREIKFEGFEPKQHFDLGEALGQMDFQSAAKLSGARFVVLKKGLARLERALGQFMLDMHTAKHGYDEVSPPLLVRDDAMFGTAQLPKFEEDQYDAGNALIRRLITAKANREKHSARVEVLKAKLEPFRLANQLPFQSNDLPSEFPLWQAELNNLAAVLIEDDKAISVLERRADSIANNLWLIPTAEVPLTNLVRESILDEAQLPMRLTACTPCFRAEAGAAGKDTRGMIRQHQFTKVELVSITTPEQSKDEHERMLSCAEEILRRLGLHYRVMTLCAGDMGFASQKTYDIEVWLPGQSMYREISSCSVCGEFQARRMNARYRTKEGRQVRHVHTLNGSGVAVGRALIAVMETYQQEDGSIAVPDALAPYMGGIKKIEQQ